MILTMTPSLFSHELQQPCSMKMEVHGHMGSLKMLIAVTIEEDLLQSDKYGQTNNMEHRAYISYPSVCKPISMGTDKEGKEDKDMVI